MEADQVAVDGDIVTAPAWPAPFINQHSNYVSSKINTLDQQEESVETDPLADSLPRFSVTNLHTLREQKFAAGLHKEPVVLPISFNASTHPFTVEPDLQGAP